jgi:RNA polymerase sigma-70 factor (ECF subfamily)
VSNWYQGRDHYIQFMAHVFAMRGPDWRMLPAAANGQPAAAAYVQAGAGYEIHSLQVFSVTGSGIGRNVVYVAPAVWGAFDVPARLAAGWAPAQR